MHILIVSHYALPHVGGVENLVDLEIRALVDVGHSVTLLTSDGGGAGRTPDYPPSVQTIRLPASHFLERRFGIPYPIFGSKLFTTLLREVAKADVIHAHGFMFMNSVAAIVAAKLMHKPSILTDHGGIQKFSSKAATLAARLGGETAGRISSLLAGRLIAYNSRIQKTLNHLGRRRDAEFLPNPVDGNLWHAPTPAERAEARRTLNWEPTRKKVLFVGRLIATKGVPLILSIADADYDLVFCGPGDVSQLGPLPRSGVEYLPPRPQSELLRLYHAADVLVLPAEVREGFPLVVQEALWCGLPVILGDDPGFEPYRVLPNLHLCERTQSALKSALGKVFAARTKELHTPPTEFFSSLGPWVKKLFKWA